MFPAMMIRALDEVLGPGKPYRRAIIVEEDLQVADDFFEVKPPHQHTSAFRARATPPCVSSHGGGGGCGTRSTSRRWPRCSTTRRRNFWPSQHSSVHCLLRVSRTSDRPSQHLASRLYPPSVPLVPRCIKRALLTRRRRDNGPNVCSDNGLDGLVSEQHDAATVLRSDFFPGLGWMLTQSMWAGQSSSQIETVANRTARIRFEPDLV